LQNDIYLEFHFDINLKSEIYYIMGIISDSIVNYCSDGTLK